MHLAFPSYFLGVFVASPAHRSLIATFSAHMDVLHHIEALCTPYMHTMNHIHCHYKPRDMERGHRQSVVPAPGTAAEQPTLDAVDDDDGTPSSAKGREPLFSVVLLAHTANAHTLSVPKTKEITTYKIPYRTLWPAFAILVFLGSEGERTQSPSSRILLTKHPSRRQKRERTKETTINNQLSITSHPQKCGPTSYYCIYRHDEWMPYKKLERMNDENGNFMPFRTLT